MGHWHIWDIQSIRKQLWISLDSFHWKYSTICNNYKLHKITSKTYNTYTNDKAVRFLMDTFDIEPRSRVEEEKTLQKSVVLI